MECKDNQITDAILSSNQKRLTNAIYVATQERTRYFVERIARTELARTYHDGVTARWDNDPDCVAYKWRMSQSHPVTDICDLYAGADLYGMGPGVFPKGKVPELPAHPHCMCYLRPLMSGSLKLKSETPTERVNKGGKEWLDKQSKTARQNILGVMGEMQYKKGGNWQSVARGYGNRYMKSRISVLGIDDGFKNRDIIKEAKKKFAYQKMIKNLPETYEQWPDIPKQRTIEECAYYANINHRNDGGGDINCQRSVIAYEMQRKGKNACAQNLSGEWKDDEIANDIGAAFIGGKTMYDLPGNGKIGVQTLLKNWGDGSRGAVSVNWPDLEYGHVFVIEYVDGGYVYVDPQTGRVGESVEIFFDKAEEEHTSVVRLDNLKFKDRVLKKCCELVMEDK